MPRSQFFELWTFKPRADRWTLIRMALQRVSGAPMPAAPKDTHAAELVQHVMTLKEKAPPGVTLARADPFLVIGDESPAEVRKRARDTVQWTRSEEHTS